MLFGRLRLVNQFDRLETLKYDKNKYLVAILAKFCSVKSMEAKIPITFFFFLMYAC